MSRLIGRLLFFLIFFGVAAVMVVNIAREVLGPDVLGRLAGRGGAPLGDTALSLPPGLLFLAVPAVVALVLLVASVKVLREYERGVVFQLGRFWKVKGPGLILVVPGIQQVVRVDLRTRVVDVPHQDVISRDNVLVRVNAVLYYRVVEPRDAIVSVEDYVAATSQLAQTTLRSVLGRHDLDEMLAEREKLNDDLQKIIDEQTESWGIKVANVELKHVDIDESMIRVIARQAEAERVRRAKIIEAEGEQQAAQKYLEAAEIIGQRSEAMQLRYLATLGTIAGERSSTIVFPFPTDLASLLGGAIGRGREPPPPRPAGREEA